MALLYNPAIVDVSHDSVTATPHASSSCTSSSHYSSYSSSSLSPSSSASSTDALARRLLRPWPASPHSKYGVPTPASVTPRGLAPCLISRSRAHSLHRVLASSHGSSTCTNSNQEDGIDDANAWLAWTRARQGTRGVPGESTCPSWRGSNMRTKKTKGRRRKPDDAARERLLSLNASARAKRRDKYRSPPEGQQQGANGTTHPVSPARRWSSRTRSTASTFPAPPATKKRAHQATDSASKDATLLAAEAARQASQRLYAMAQGQTLSLARRQHAAAEAAAKAQAALHTFRPVITKMAQQMAPRRRACEEQAGAAKAERLALARLQQMSAALKECTFRPALSPHSARLVAEQRHDKQLRQQHKHSRHGSPPAADCHDGVNKQQWQQLQQHGQLVAPSVTAHTNTASAVVSARSEQGKGRGGRAGRHYCSHEPVGDTGERLYREGRRQLLRQQIRRRRAVDAERAGVVGSGVCLDAADIKLLTARLTAWQQRHANRYSQPPGQSRARTSAQQPSRTRGRTPPRKLRSSFVPSHTHGDVHHTTSHRCLSPSSGPVNAAAVAPTASAQHRSSSLPCVRDLSPSATGAKALATSRMTSERCSRREAREPRQIQQSTTRQACISVEPAARCYGALFHKFAATSRSGDVVRLCDVRRLVQRLYPDDAYAAVALTRYLRTRYASTPPGSHTAATPAVLPDTNMNDRATSEHMGEGAMDTLELNKESFVHALSVMHAGWVGSSPETRYAPRSRSRLPWSTLDAPTIHDAPHRSIHSFRHNTSPYGTTTTTTTTTATRGRDGSRCRNDVGDGSGGNVKGGRSLSHTPRRSLSASLSSQYASHSHSHSHPLSPNPSQVTVSSASVLTLRGVRSDAAAAALLSAARPGVKPCSSRSCANSRAEKDETCTFRPRLSRRTRELSWQNEQRRRAQAALTAHSDSTTVTAAHATNGACLDGGDRVHANLEALRRSTRPAVLTPAPVWHSKTGQHPTTTRKEQGPRPRSRETQLHPRKDEEARSQHCSREPSLQHAQRDQPHEQSDSSRRCRSRSSTSSSSRATTLLSASVELSSLTSSDECTRAACEADGNVTEGRIAVDETTPGRTRDASAERDSAVPCGESREISLRSSMIDAAVVAKLRSLLTTSSSVS